MSSLQPPSGGRPPQEGNKTGKVDPYQEVTDLIIGHLENGVVPWRCPWNRDTGRPRNFFSGAAYQGINSILLGCRFAPSPWWLTYRQAQKLGGQVRKGEKGSLVVKYGTFDLKSDNPEEETPQRGFLRRFIVFNSSQIDGVNFPEASDSATPLSGGARIAAAELVVECMPNPPSIHEGNAARAFYRPSEDAVHMPPRNRFESVEAFYRTLYHELAHSTGHPSRLDRDSLKNHDGFGGKVYSREELVAEMCAAFLAMETNIASDRHEQSAAYLSGWLTVLKSRDNRRWIVQAASQASRAADFILCRSESRETAPGAAEDDPPPT